MMWLLSRLIDPELAENILGDFEEYARQRYPTSRARAALWMWGHVLGVVLAATVERGRGAIVASSPAAQLTRARGTPRLLRWGIECGHDLAQGWRMFRRRPGFGVAAVLTLALGIGCTSAIFSVVNALLVRPLPYDDAHGLVQIAERVPRNERMSEAEAVSGIEPADVAELRARSRTLSLVGFHAPVSQTMTTQGQAIRLSGARVSPAIFDMLRAQPLLGRTFRADEEAPGAERTLIVSFAAWRQYFRGDPKILTRRVIVDGEVFAIAGVMHEAFAFPDRQTDIWMPFVLAPVMGGQYSALARLREGVAVQTAQEEVNALLSTLRTESPTDAPTDRRPRFHVVAARDALTEPVKPALTVLMVAVGLVLLIACTNVANLLVAQALARRREISVRRAIGAGRSRLVRQVLTESVLLSILGGVAGIAFAVGLVDVVQAIGVGLSRQDLGPPLSIPRLDEVRLDLSALAFTLGVSVLTGLIFGVIPAIEQTRGNATDLLRNDGGASFSVGGRRPIQGVLIVLQIAVATILLVAAGLQLHSFAKLSMVNPGYDPRNVVTFQVVFPDDTATLTFADDLVAALEPLPAIQAVGYAASLPMVQTVFISPLSRTPGPLPQPRAPLTFPTPEFPDSRVVSRGFLEALGVRVIEGRGLLPIAQGSGLREVLVNRTLARSGYLGSTPIGQQVYAGGRLAEVVGIVEDVRQVGLDEVPSPQVFGLAQGGGPTLYYAVRTNGRPASQVATIRQIVRRLVPEAGLYNVATMDEIVASSIGRRRLYAVLMGIFAAIAATLAAVGVYGMVAYAVTRRTREIGIRIALGAHPRSVLGLVMRDATTLSAIGVVLGLGGAVGATRALESMLFELSPLDPATFAVAGLFFTVVSLAAALWAARRAATGDPVIALRSD